ncbi:MAG: cell division protein CrgA [Acidimicrobiales bacterium]
MATKKPGRARNQATASATATASGRATPKSSGRVTPPASGRYTPPIPRNAKVSPKWVPVIMLALLISGPIVVIINYIGLLPGGASNWYLLLGLALISVGFLAATQYR